MPKDETLKWTLIILAGFILMVFMMNSESYRISQGERIAKLENQFNEILGDLSKK